MNNLYKPNWHTCHLCNQCENFTIGPSEGKPKIAKYQGTARRATAWRHSRL